jgi:hypothetical protein
MADHHRRQVDLSAPFLVLLESNERLMECSQDFAHPKDHPSGAVARMLPLRIDLRFSPLLGVFRSLQSFEESGPIAF